MITLAYAKRLRRDMQDWVANGWVERDKAALILASLETHQRHRLPLIVAILGVIFLGAAAMTFVAANWTEMPRLARLALLIGAMWAAYLIAAVLMVRQSRAFAEAALLLGVALYGVNIMLIAQMYHISAHYPDGVLWWGLGALAAAWLIGARSPLSFALGLFTLWTGIEGFAFGPQVHWPYLLAWAACVAQARRRGWLFEQHLAMIGILFWLAMNIYAYGDLAGWDGEHVLSLLFLCGVLIWLTGIHLAHTEDSFAAAIHAYGLLTVLPLGFIFQLVDPGVVTDSASWLALAGIAALACLLLALWALLRKQLSAGSLAAYVIMTAAAFAFPLAIGEAGDTAHWIYVILYIALVVWVIAHGTQVASRFATNIGFTAFGIEVLYIYFETLGTLLDTAAFFFIGGIILIITSAALETMRRRLIGQQIGQQTGQTTGTGGEAA